MCAGSKYSKVTSSQVQHDEQLVWPEIQKYRDQESAPHFR